MARVMLRRCGAGLLALSLLPALSRSTAAEEKNLPEGVNPPEGVYVQVDGRWQEAKLPLKELASGKAVEVKVVGKLTTGVIVIGAETTGTTIRFDDTTWELELSGNKKLPALAAKLNGKSVVAIGKVRTKRGIEVPLRTIVTVAILQPAPLR